MLQQQNPKMNLGQMQLNQQAAMMRQRLVMQQYGMPNGPQFNPAQLAQLRMGVPMQHQQIQAMQMWHAQNMMAPQEISQQYTSSTADPAVYKSANSPDLASDPKTRPVNEPLVPLNIGWDEQNSTSEPTSTNQFYEHTNPPPATTEGHGSILLPGIVRPSALSASNTNWLSSSSRNPLMDPFNVSKRSEKRGADMGYHYGVPPAHYAEAYIDDSTASGSSDGYVEYLPAYISTRRRRRPLESSHQEPSPVMGGWYPPAGDPLPEISTDVLFGSTRSETKRAKKPTTDSYLYYGQDQMSDGGSKRTRRPLTSGTKSPGVKSRKPLPEISPDSDNDEEAAKRKKSTLAARRSRARRAQTIRGTADIMDSSASASSSRSSSTRLGSTIVDEQFEAGDKGILSSRKRHRKKVSPSKSTATNTANQSSSGDEFERIYSCFRCDKKYDTLESLADHTRECPGMYTTPDKDFPSRQQSTFSKGVSESKGLWMCHTISEDRTGNQEAVLQTMLAALNCKQYDDFHEDTAAVAKRRLLSNSPPEKENKNDQRFKGRKMLTSNFIWDRLQSMEKFRNGEIDIDNLVAELREKAKCSEGGAVVAEEDVNKILGI